jgi:hypothetical protein
MNCHEFTLQLDALAHARLADAARRDEALRHAEDCARCAARWRDARTLAQALQLTAQAETARAPEHLKNALLASFAAQRAAPPNVVSLSSWQPRRVQRQWWLAVAAALAVCLALGLAARQWRAGNNAGVTVKKEEPTPPQPIQTPIVIQGGSGTPAMPDKPKTSDAPPTLRVAYRKPVPRRLPAVPQRTMRKPVVSAQPTELVTEYIPLTYLATPTAIESGQVVRINLPRSSAVALGLPAHVSSSEENIKADVVMGDDGLARQIRFVYQADNAAARRRSP